LASGEVGLESLQAASRNARTMNTTLLRGARPKG
jgi:hypothetical protein